jgi:hypothetical protein
MKTLYQILIHGNEKAVAGFLASGALSLLSIFSITGDMTVEQALTAFATAAVTAVSVYLKANRG